MTSPCFSLDGEDVPFEPGDTLLAAARRAGRYIPHLCWHPGFAAHGSCRICTVLVAGRAGAACTVAAAEGLEVESNTEELNAHRKNCLLQATAYQMGMEGPHFEEFYPDRPVDASHPDVLLDFNRCILCGLCVRASQAVDGKDVFALVGHGMQTRLAINSVSGRLVDSALAAGDCAAGICPVGAILPKRRGFVIPIGERRYDTGTAADIDRQEAS